MVREIGPVTSCGRWLEARKQNTVATERLMDEQWVIGFASAAAVVAQKDVLSKTDADAVWAVLDNICRNQPLISVAEAMPNLVSG